MSFIHTYIHCYRETIFLSAFSARNEFTAIQPITTIIVVVIINPQEKKNHTEPSPQPKTSHPTNPPSTNPPFPLFHPHPLIHPSIYSSIHYLHTSTPTPPPSPPFQTHPFHPHPAINSNHDDSFLPSFLLPFIT